jgi:hypothetical protein
MLQPVEYINTNCYKIGLSSTCDLNRLKSYGVGTRYIQYFECSNYREAETELINNLNNDQTVNLFKGREYFCGNKQTILSIFIQVMLKYTNMEEEDIIKEEENKEEEVENRVGDVIKEVFVDKIHNKKVENVNSKEVFKNNKNQYSCKLCSLTTKDKKDFNKHLNTIKHKKKFTNDNICKTCFKVFSNKSNKTRHEKQCSI